MMRVQLSLGSNLGDREANLWAALDLIDRVPGVAVVSQSDCYETEPVGKSDQPDFINMAAEIETDLNPLELLDAVKEIEVALGRATSERWGPRLIDIDIVLWGDTVVESARLTIPHKEFRRRAFVLAPLFEIAADAVDPVTGKTVAELAMAPESMGRVRRLCAGVLEPMTAVSQ